MTYFGAAVIGAGPAGAIAATCLARRGLQVALIDPGPREGPVIGETLPAMAAQILARHGFPGPLDGSSHVPISGTVSAWDGPTVTETSMSRPGGPDWRLDRVLFNAALKEPAAAAGADLVAGKVRAVRRRDSHWDLSLDGEALSAGLIVDASGRQNVVGRGLNVPRDRQTRQIAVWAIGVPLGGHRTTRTLIQAKGSGWWYGAVLPSGRPVGAYHCPVDEALSLRRRPENWHANLCEAQILSSRLDPAAFEGVTLHFTDAGGSASIEPAGPGWAACGDAAIAFDPVAAQGLLNAVRTGIAAAEAVTGGTAARHRYCAEVREVWLRYLARHRVLHTRRRTAQPEV